jgi:hypothetical protein
MNAPCKECLDTAHPSGWTAHDGFGSDLCRLRWHEARVITLEAALRALVEVVDRGADAHPYTEIATARKVLR